MVPYIRIFNSPGSAGVIEVAIGATFAVGTAPGRIPKGTAGATDGARTEAAAKTATERQGRSVLGS